MSLNTHHCWAIVTSNRQKAIDIIYSIRDEQAKLNNKCIEATWGRHELKAVFEDGHYIRWIEPNNNCRGYRFHRLWCDKDINQDYLEQVILPMAVYMKYENIIWI